MFYSKICLMLLFPFFSFATNRDLISSMLIRKNRLDVKINEKLEKKYFRQLFFVEYDNDINLQQLHQSIILIPFISSVITAVWVSNEDYYIDYLDKDFAQGLEIIRINMKKMYPSLQWQGRLIARKLIDNQHSFTPPISDKVAVLFSGGVDTTCTSLRNIHLNQLLITVWGSDVSPYDYQMWHGVEKICKDFSQTHSHEFTYVRSNFTGLFSSNLYTLTPEIPRWWKYTSMGLSYCGLVAPILVTKGIKKLLVGSTYTDKFTCPYGSLPMIDENVTYAGISVIHDSYDLNRQEKIALIAKISKQFSTKPFLRPCWKGDTEGKNCQKCLGKCLQTINALLIEQENPRDYGFTLSDEEIIHKTYKQFLSITHPPQFSRGAIDRWKTMQLRIKEKLANTSTAAQYSSLVRNYLIWLTTINMEKFI